MERQNSSEDKNLPMQDLYGEFSYWELRKRLFLVVAITALPALGLILFLGFQQHRLALAQTKQETLRLVRLASTTQDYLLEGVHQQLAVLSELPQVQESPRACHNLMTKLAKQYPYYANLGVIRPDGTVFCSVLPLPANVNLSDRPYFRRAIKTQNFSVGDYQISRISGKAVLNCGYPIFNSKGEISGVAFASLDLSWLNHLVTQAQMPEGSVMTVFDRNGTVLVRHPDPTHLTGKSFPESRLVKQILMQKQKESTILTEGLDKIKRLYAYRTLGETTSELGVYATIGVPVAAAFKEASQTVKWSLIYFFCVVAFALAAAWFTGNALVVRTQEKLREFSITDELTRLNNRRGFLFHLEQHIKLATRNQKGFLLLMLDIDGLKQVNDTGGHSEGDKLLKRMAEVLRETFRGSDVLARVGGDEFSVAAVDTTPDRLEIINQRLEKCRQKVNQRPDIRTPLAFSMGWAYFDTSNPVSLEILIKKADYLLYEEKSRKRERTV